MGKDLEIEVRRIQIHRKEWLGEEDSNLRTQIQSLVSCR